LKITHVFFSHCIGYNHVNLRTRFCFKNNARRVLRSPSARAGNTVAKRKRTITDLQNTTQKTIISPTAIYFFHRKLKSDFYFLDIPKTMQINICCFSGKHAALRRKSKDWSARNQDNVSEWGDMSIRGLLFLWASTIKIQLSVLV
jgi:hypothetical protein